jgi:hypothetical protein
MKTCMSEMTYRSTALAAGALLAGCFAVSPVLAQTSSQTNTNPAPTAARAPSHYQPDRFAGRAGQYYRLVWGVDSLAVKWVESGEMIRFTYRVLDADRARVLNEKRAEPLLTNPQAGVQLVVPKMEKIGQLRQSNPPEAGKSYWMTFSNKGRLIKRGDRVSVVIGQFRADGLVVD